MDDLERMINLAGGGGTLPLGGLHKKAKAEAKEITQMIEDDKYKVAAYHMRQLQNTLESIVAAEKELEAEKTDEDSVMQGMVDENKKPCSQCGSTECDCPPGECDCEPIGK